MAKNSKQSSEWQPFNRTGTKSRQYISTTTGEVISRRQFDQRYGRLAGQGPAAFERQAKSRKTFGIPAGARISSGKTQNSWQPASAVARTCCHRLRPAKAMSSAAAAGTASQGVNATSWTPSTGQSAGTARTAETAATGRAAGMNSHLHAVAVRLHPAGRPEAVMTRV